MQYTCTCTQNDSMRINVKINLQYLKGKDNLLSLAIYIKSQFVLKSTYTIAWQSPYLVRICWRASPPNKYGAGGGGPVEY